MTETYKFLSECECFYVLTINGDFPAGRPFGAVMEVGEDLYISTGDKNEVHKQLLDNGNIQIIAKKEGTREWIRITGTAQKCDSLDMKQRMMDECPKLKSHYSSADSDHYLLFRVKVLNTELK